MWQILTPLLSLCLNDYLGMRLICSFDNTPPPVVKSNKEEEKSCYQDGIFYPRCKDLEDPNVWHYHKLLSNP
jgi:hypothetical protein